MLRRALFVIMAALLLGAAGSVWAAPRPGGTITVGEYWTLLNESALATSELRKQPAEEARAGMKELAARWEAVESVELQSGEIIPIDASFIVSKLRAENADASEMHTRFTTWSVMDRRHPEPRFTKEDLQPLGEILSRPEFQWKDEQPNPVNDWFQKLWDRFAAWLDKIIPDFNLPAINLTPLGAILLVLILLYAFRGIFVDLIADARLNANGEPGDEILTADSAFQRAQSLSRGGDYRAAVRYLYLSSLLLLDERGLMRYDRTRTNREYLGAVSDKPELAQPLSEVIEVFDNVWYGYHELDEAEFKHYSDRVEELKDKKP